VLPSDIEEKETELAELRRYKEVAEGAPEAAPPVSDDTAELAALRAEVEELKTERGAARATITQLQADVAQKQALLTVAESHIESVDSLSAEAAAEAAEAAAEAAEALASMPAASLPEEDLCEAFKDENWGRHERFLEELRYR